MCGNVRIEHITEGTMASGVTEVLVAENCNLSGDDGTTYPGIFLHFVKDSTVVDVHPDEKDDVLGMVNDLNNDLNNIIESTYGIELNVPMLLEAKIGRNWLDTVDV